MDCTDGYGCLCYDHVVWSMLTHWNTPNQDTGISPVEMLYRYTIRDHHPIPGEKYKIYRCWREMKGLREKVMSKRHQLNQKQNNTHSHPLQELQVDKHLQGQNQDGHIHDGWRQEE